MLAAAMVAVLVCLTGGAVCLGSAVAARHRVQSAADLAALAAAAALPAGVAVACARASGVIQQLGAHPIDCAADGLDVVVTADVAVPLVRGARARAVARAGPLETD